MYVNITAGNLRQCFSSVSSSSPFPVVLVSPVDNGAGEPGVQYCCFHLKGHLDNQVITFYYFNIPSHCCFLSFPRSKIKLRLAGLPLLFFLRHFADRIPGTSGGGGGTRTLHKQSPLGHTCSDQTPSTSALYDGSSPKSTFFSSMANYSLLNTNPSKTKVFWDLIQPSLTHVQL